MVQDQKTVIDVDRNNRGIFYMKKSLIVVFLLVASFEVFATRTYRNRYPGPSNCVSLQKKEEFRNLRVQKAQQEKEQNKQKKQHFKKIQAAALAVVMADQKS